MIGLIALGLTLVCLVARVFDFIRDHFPVLPPPGYHGPLFRKDEWGYGQRDYYFFRQSLNGCGCVSCENVRTKKWIEDRFPELVAFVKQKTETE